jgi:hypothetical protein
MTRIGYAIQRIKDAWSVLLGKSRAVRNASDEEIVQAYKDMYAGYANMARDWARNAEVTIQRDGKTYEGTFGFPKTE